MNTRTTECRYNLDGLMEELVCHNESEGEQVTRWEYGTTLNEDESGIARADLVRAKVYPDGGRVEYGYNRLSELARMKDPNGTVHEYDYDAVNRFTADRVTRVGENIDAAVRAIRASYFPRGEREKVTSYNSPSAIASGNVVNEVLYAYNGFGQEVSEWQSHDGSADTGTTPGVAYGYENGSANTIRLGAALFPAANPVIYGYNGSLNGAFNLVSAIGPEVGSPFVGYERLGLGAIVRTSYGAGLEMTSIAQGMEGVGDGGDIYTGLDRFGRLQEARWLSSSADVERVEFGFDRKGNKTWRRNLLSGAQPWDELYRYDGLYQVTGLDRGKLNVSRTSVNGVPAWQEQWRYDEMGNWLRYDTAIEGAVGLEQERDYNAANELLFINGSNARVGYDESGNMIRTPQPADWDAGYMLEWDAWNRLVQVKDQESGTVLARYGYDGLTRRITKETEIGTIPVLRHFYYSNRWQVVEERVDAATTPDRQFLWGVKNVDDLVYRARFAEGVESERLWSLNDGKNVTAIADGTSIEERYGYEGFGSPIVLNAGFEPRAGNQSAYGWETLFCGYRWDEESEFYQVRYRYYHPALGRWLGRDPIKEEAGTSLFRYLDNEPVTPVDPSGLQELTPRDPLPDPWPPVSIKPRAPTPPGGLGGALCVEYCCKQEALSNFRYIPETGCSLNRIEPGKCYAIDALYYPGKAVKINSLGIMTIKCKYDGSFDQITSSALTTSEWNVGEPNPPVPNWPCQDDQRRPIFAPYADVAPR